MRPVGRQHASAWARVLRLLRLRRLARVLGPAVSTALGLASVGGYAGPAQAHSTAPVPVSLVWATDDPAELPLVVTDRGLIFADPVAGQTRFSLRCGEAYEARTTDKPSVFRDPGGALTIGLYHGVYHSTDRACTLQPSSGLPEEPIGSVVRAARPSTSLFALLPDVELGAVLASDDGGRHWSERFRNPANEFFSFLVPAPSAPDRLYAGGVRIDQAAMSVSFLCSVSSDAGKSWEHHVHATKTVPFAVYPADPNVMLAYEPTDRFEAEFRILRSSDACSTFTRVLEGIVQPTAVAMSPDGSNVWIGAAFRGMGGLYHSSDGGLHFQRVMADTVWMVNCLHYRQGRLWMCANQAPGFDGIWYSDDQGGSFQKFLTFDQVSESVACEGEAQAICEAPWADFARELLSDAGVALGGDASAQAGTVDAGEPTGLDASAPYDAGAIIGEHDAGQGQGEPERESSGCQAVATSRGAAFSAWLLGLAWLLARTRRRRS